MNAVTIDTHKVITMLEKKGFSRTQAEGLVDAARTINTTEMAKKDDVAKAILELKNWVLILMLGQVAVFTAVTALVLDLIIN